MQFAEGIFIPREFQQTVIEPKKYQKMNLSILLGALGPWEIVLIVLALLLLFGGKKIPELMKGLGQGMKEFKKASSNLKNDLKSESDPINPEKEIEPGK